MSQTTSAVWTLMRLTLRHSRAPQNSELGQCLQSGDSSTQGGDGA